jgi:hypothetical protein
MADDERGRLPEPTTALGELLRSLADTAMSITHHDAADDEPGYRHEVEEMERRFSPLIRRYVAKHFKTRKA